MSAGDASRLSDDSAIAQIFHPGFSTAETVTDTSGRGVGMDIVKSKIEELSGTIQIETTVGGGTTFVLKLPLTLAIIGSLLVRIRGVVYAIPKDDVREIVSVHRDNIIPVAGKETFEVRGKFIPLMCVGDLFHWNPSNEVEKTESDAVSAPLVDIAILQSAGRTIGLLVDQLLGSQDVVIKSLADHFVALPGLAGASILGNGTVALMLDVAELHKMARR